MDEGSRRISNVSISAGFKKSILSWSTPSTTYKGLALLGLFTPLILTTGVAPALPELDTVRPATLPCSDEIGFVDGILATSSPFTDEIEPVRSLFLCVP